MTDATADPAESGRIAAFFDLDKTVIAKSSVLAFTRPFFEHGLLSHRAVLASTYAQLLFVLSTVDQERVDRMREHIAQMCKGWDVEQIRSIVDETLDEIVTPLVYAEAKDLIADHHARGHDVVIVSASGEEVVTPIAQALGASYSAASRMRIVHGRYAGELEFYCFGEAKSTAIRELAVSHGYDLARCYAYSDSATDVPMLQVVGKPRAVNPDRVLRRVANENDWPILTFTRPVPLSRRVRPSAKGLLGLAVAGAAAALITGAAVYLAGRRHGPAQHLRLTPLPG